MALVYYISQLSADFIFSTISIIFGESMENDLQITDPPRYIYVGTNQGLMSA